MKSVLCFGEALIDFLNSGQTQESILSIPEFRQFPGGAPANVAVAIAKLGGKSSFLGQLGDDHFGHYIKEALIKYGVDTQYLAFHPTAKTAMAFVFLDQDGERSFEFYREKTADLLFTVDQLSNPCFSEHDIFHFCSNTLTDSAIAKTTTAAIQQAKDNNTLVSFDVNLRHNLWDTGQANSESIYACLEQSDIVKISREELDYLDNEGEQNFAKRLIGSGVKLLLITDGANAIKIIAKGIHSAISIPAVSVIDTTAAGDAFSGGFLYALCQQEDLYEAIADQETLESIVVFASICGAITVTRAGAYPALPTLEEVQEFEL